MNSIKIKLSKTDEDLFLQSKWWGNPDVPEGFEVPDLPTFICQIRCDEIAEFDEDNMLPHKGMLYFFSDLEYFFGEDDELPEYFEDLKVIYIEDIETPKFEQVIFVDDDDKPYALEELAMEFSKGEPSCDGNKLLGEPHDREWEDWYEPYTGWTELLQVISDNYEDYNGRRGFLNFMDEGTMHFIIDPEDLKNRNFDNVVALICST